MTLFLFLAAILLWHGVSFMPLGVKQDAVFFIEYGAAIFFGIFILFWLWMYVAYRSRQGAKSGLVYASLVFSPILLLLMPRPDDIRQSAVMPLVIVFLTMFCFYLLILGMSRRARFVLKNEKKWAAVLTVIYAAVFISIGVMQLNHFTFFNPKDFATYNQTFWNSVHGRWFINSTYGSNFTCHNSPFYFFIMPVYEIFPAPQTLIILKILLFAFSVIPLYKIFRLILPEFPLLPLVLAYLFNPFLVSQNLTPPHEPSFAPFFILTAYYYFLK